MTANKVPWQKVQILTIFIIMNISKECEACQVVTKFLFTALVYMRCLAYNTKTGKVPGNGPAGLLLKLSDLTKVKIF